MNLFDSPGGDAPAFLPFPNMGAHNPSGAGDLPFDFGSGDGTNGDTC